MPNPALSLTAFRDALMVALIAAAALALVGWISHQSLAGRDIPFMLASMGATAVILFAVPSSPMGRPWPLFAGHLLAALIGVSCGKLFGNLLISVPLAIGLTIFLMLLFRCVHPPGGATALLALLGGPEIEQLGYQFLIAPLGINLVVMASAAYGINALLNERRRRLSVTLPPGWQNRHDGFPIAQPNRGDLASALAGVNGYVDVDATTLQQIYEQARQHQQQRLLGGRCCREVMKVDVPVAEYGTELLQVWQWLATGEDGAVVVTDRVRHVIGIVTLSDFIRHAGIFDLPGREQRIEALITPTTTLTSDKPEAAGQIMTPEVVCVGPETPLNEALNLLLQHQIHHLPVVDEWRKFLGMVELAGIQALLRVPELPVAEWDEALSLPAKRKGQGATYS